MAARPQGTRVVAEIKKRYGSVINLDTSPAVLIEILRNYGRLFVDDDGTGGMGPGGTSTVAVGINDGGTNGGTGTGGTGTGGTGSGGTGTGGTGSGGTSTVAVGITPPESNIRLELDEILRAVLGLKKDISAVSKQLGRLATGK